MQFWWFMFVCNVLIPISMIVVGRMMKKHCGKGINKLSGYRTARSMKNIDTWKFANNYCGSLCWKLGWVLIAPTILCQIPFYGSGENTISILSLVICTFQIVVMILTIISTENALKKKFFDDGTYR